MKKAFSFVEIIVALAILGVGLATIFSALSAAKDTAVKTDVAIAGRLLAQSIIEQVRHRMHVTDSRFFKLGTPPDQVLRDAVQRKWKLPFEALAQPRAKVVGPAGTTGQYFDPASGPPMPANAATDPFWTGFSYEVRVSFDIAADAGGARQVIDADDNGKGEIDLARVEVEVLHRANDGSLQDRSVVTLSTLVVAPDRAPGSDGLAQEGAP